MPTQVKVICFYTANTPYEQEVENLRISCENHEVDAHIEAKSSAGSWEKNVALKPFFILEKLLHFQSPILWIDADAVFLQKPDFSLFMESDLSLRTNQLFVQDKRFSLCGGTIFINYTRAGVEFVEKWCKRCNEQIERETVPFIDQITLYEELQENNNVKLFPMPISYCKIYDIDSFFINDEDVIIEHRQASRTFKHLIQ